eukprot:scaffold42219_cov54-Phaeocystis_antarctica.AAC.2
MPAEKQAQHKRKPRRDSLQARAVSRASTHPWIAWASPHSARLYLGPHPSRAPPFGPYTLRAPPSRVGPFGTAVSPIRALLTAWSAPQVVRPLLLKWLAALCVLDCAAASSRVLTLNVTYYDFRVHEDGHNNPTTHPDFERSCHKVPHSFDPCIGEAGLVEATLGADGRRRAWHRACGTA